MNCQILNVVNRASNVWFVYVTTTSFSLCENKNVISIIAFPQFLTIEMEQMVDNFHIKIQWHARPTVDTSAADDLIAMPEIQHPWDRLLKYSELYQDFAYSAKEGPIIATH